MTNLLCKCGRKLAEYDDYEVRIKDIKNGNCTYTAVLQVVDGKIVEKRVKL
jgi:hypothetical protein